MESILLEEHGRDKCSRIVRSSIISMLSDGTSRLYAPHEQTKRCKNLVVYEIHRGEFREVTLAF